MPLLRARYSLTLAVLVFLCGCANAELSQDESDANLDDDSGSPVDVGVEDTSPDTDLPDVDTPADTRDTHAPRDGGDDEPACVPLTCEELSACGVVGDDCGGSIDCGDCPEVAEVTVAPDESQVLQVGEELEFTAAATAADGADVFCDFQWSSQDPTVARVDASGRVSALVAGITDIRVECRGETTRVRVYINDSGLPDSLTDADDIAAWLRADVGLNFSGGAQVEEWEDLSGNGVRLTNDSFSRHPSRINNVLNGHPVLRFTGTHELRASSPVALTEATVVAVVRNDDPAHRGQILSDCPDGGDNQLRFDGAARSLYLFGGENGLEEAVTLQEATTNHQVITVVLTQSLLEVFQNGQPQASTSVSSSGAWNLSQVGARCSSDYLRGDIAELMIYRRALDGPDRQQVEAYLTQRYDLF